MQMLSHDLCLYPSGWDAPLRPVSALILGVGTGRFFSSLPPYFIFSSENNLLVLSFILSLVPLLQTFTYLALPPSTRSKTYIYGISHFKI